MEGISQEAISLAGHLKLSKLIVLFDDNNISIDGAIDLSDSTDQLMRFEASGWNVNRVDGHNHDDIEKAIQEAIESNKPSLIACKTKIGFGSPSKEGKSSSHGAPLGAEDTGPPKVGPVGEEAPVAPSPIVIAQGAEVVTVYASL